MLGDESLTAVFDPAARYGSSNRFRLQNSDDGSTNLEVIKRGDTVELWSNGSSPFAVVKKSEQDIRINRRQSDIIVGLGESRRTALFKDRDTIVGYHFNMGGQKFEWLEHDDRRMRWELGPNSTGFVLVHWAHPGDHPNPFSNEDAEWQTDDGQEILAMWGTTGNQNSYSPFTFRVCGTGADEQAVGKKFPVVALMSALQIREWIR
ncbi:hypothetical protein GGR53DRAFT_525517 [Hypoxylon sp. FL1150]|nr:hypothetical protein GGR53DRAFT_525517 [Hypoxylon sp. FL1150]